MSGRLKLVALNAGLAAGLVLIVWQGRVRWVAAQAERRAVVNAPIKKVTPPPATPVQKPDAVQAAKYADVAAKNPFSKDRNPTVILDVPKVEPPKVMPPLPVVFGVLSLPSGAKAIMSERAGAPSRSVHTGDSVGEFKVVALDSRKVTFEWDGKQLEKNLDDLVDRSGGTVAGSSQGASSGPAAPAAPPVAPKSASDAMGAEIGTAEAPAKACKPNENSALGTVVDGYKKSGVQSPFGIMGCSWVKEK
jgi:hypothetical protein